MLTYTTLLQPETVAEAYEDYSSRNSSILLGGGCWLRLSRRPLSTVIDLSGLELRYIREWDDEIIIGGMTTLRDIELSPMLQAFAGGVLVEGVRTILGPQFRACATIGGSVAAKFGFSDILPILLTLNTDVELYEAGRISLADYLACPRMRELVVNIIIEKENILVARRALRNSAGDFPYLTGAVSLTDKNVWKIAVGARPMVAKLAEKASAVLTEKGITVTDTVAMMAKEELNFQTNSHASKDYRRDMTAVMVGRMIKEVWACK